MFTASMRFDLGDEVNALREMVHSFAQARIKPCPQRRGQRAEITLEFLPFLGEKFRVLVVNRRCLLVLALLDIFLERFTCAASLESDQRGQNGQSAKRAAMSRRLKNKFPHKVPPP